jgi:urea transport system ATP-binding protein
MLHVQDVNVYYGESQILHSVALDVPDDQVVSLMGRNGVGKTTLLKTIMGVLRPRAGRILLGGDDVTRRLPNQRAQAGIGYVPQGRGIFPYLSVYENLLMGLEAMPRGLDAETSLEEVYATFPVLKQMRKRMAGTLSGGQQQQLAIGRVLIRRPTLLVLDEPTEGVQPNIVQEIEQVIVSLRERGGLSILLVDQFLDFALRVADHYYIMETGAIVVQGPISEFDEGAVKGYLAV